MNVNSSEKYEWLVEFLWVTRLEAAQLPKGQVTFPWETDKERDKWSPHILFLYFIPPGE